MAGAGLGRGCGSCCCTAALTMFARSFPGIQLDAHHQSHVAPFLPHECPGMQGRTSAATMDRTGSRSATPCTSSMWTSWLRTAWRTPASARMRSWRSECCHSIAAERPCASANANHMLSKAGSTLSRAVAPSGRIDICAIADAQDEEGGCGKEPGAHLQVGTASVLTKCNCRNAGCVIVCGNQTTSSLPTPGWCAFVCACSAHHLTMHRGKWATASPEEVQEAKDAGIPYCYRFRTPKVSNVADLAAA